VIEGVDDRVDHLSEVVGRDVRGHADGDAAGSVHQQVGEPRREHDRLLFVSVVVGDEIHGLGVDVAEHLHRRRREACFRVSGRRRRVAVDGSEVPVRVDQGMAEREVLGHPDEGVVDRRLTVRVVLGHHAAHDVGRFPVRAIRPQALLEHRPEDPAVDRLQPVANLRQRPPDDDGHRVVEVRPLDLFLELHGLDTAREQSFLRHIPPTRPGCGRTWRWSR
jgi:hypothetical protein